MKLTELEAIPSAVTTVTGTVAGAATSAVVTANVNVVEFTVVAERLTPLKVAVMLATKPVPVTVNVNPAEPAVPEGGLREVIVGAGLMVKLTGAEAVPSADTTVTAAVPAEARSAVVMSAVA